MDGDPTRVYKTTTNGASNVAAFPPVWAQRGGVGDNADRQTIVNVLAKVSM